MRENGKQKIVVHLWSVQWHLKILMERIFSSHLGHRTPSPPFYIFEFETSLRKINSKFGIWRPKIDVIGTNKAYINLYFCLQNFPFCARRCAPSTIFGQCAFYFSPFLFFFLPSKNIAFCAIVAAISLWATKMDCRWLWQKGGRGAWKYGVPSPFRNGQEPKAFLRHFNPKSPPNANPVTARQNWKRQLRGRRALIKCVCFGVEEGILQLCGGEKRA